MIVSASDNEITKAQKLLAENGIWVEPASAASIAGMKKMIEGGQIKLNGKTIVAVCTGHGLKDPDIISRNFKSPMIIPADLISLEKEIFHG
jgi:threonine synthase